MIVESHLPGDKIGKAQILLHISKSWDKHCSRQLLLKEPFKFEQISSSILKTQWWLLISHEEYNFLIHWISSILNCIRKHVCEHLTLSQMLCILILHFGNVDADLDYKNEKLKKKERSLTRLFFSCFDRNARV